MRTIVISQPMFFPWIGIFAQACYSDFFVHYDDVQLPQGRSFMSRVQVKTEHGSKWLTAPLKKHNSNTLIMNAELVIEENWREKHLKFLAQVFARAPYVREMLEIVRDVYDIKCDNLSELNIAGIERISSYFGLSTCFIRSSKLGFSSASTDKILDIVTHLNGRRYITGHGARNYLKHEKFEEKDIRVEYMDYNIRPYSQLYGAFTPYVTILDLIANMGQKGKELISSPTIYWKDFINDR